MVITLVGLPYLPFVALECLRYTTKPLDAKRHSSDDLCEVLGGLLVSVFATGPKHRGFNPGRERWIFKSDKNP
jgi:hypothetical protein